MAHSNDSQDDIISGINVVPLVDIVLVLLIIFMVTANVINQPAIDMELPKADTGDRKERNQFSLLLGAKGEVAIGDKKIAEADIEKEFAAIFEGYKKEKQENSEATLSDLQLTVMARNELTMVIQADTEVSHGRVIHFIDLARKTGILKYAFNVDPNASQGAEAATKPIEQAKATKSASVG
jgi:biopolymer transport protein ExbD